MSFTPTKLFTEAAKELNLKRTGPKKLCIDLGWLEPDGMTITKQAQPYLTYGEKNTKDGKVKFVMFTLAGWYEFRKELKRLEELVEFEDELLGT